MKVIENLKAKNQGNAYDHALDDVLDYLREK